MELLPGVDKRNLPTRAYASDALEPFFDNSTMDIHFTRHHQAYVTNLRTALNKYPELDAFSLDQLVRFVGTSAIPSDVATVVRNHGGGHWNHAFFWKILAPPTSPYASFDASASQELKDAITAAFGDFSTLKTKFNTAATGVFGSGWAWLALDPLSLQLILTTTPNQDNPLMSSAVVAKAANPILGVDVWEHSYYLKYQNRRADFLSAFWSVVDWQVVSTNFATAKMVKY